MTVKLISIIALFVLIVKAAHVRVAHLSPDAPAVDVLVNGTVAFRNLSFKGITSYAILPPAYYHIQVVPTGKKTPVVIDVTVQIPDYTFTIAAENVLSSITPFIYQDNTTHPSLGSAAVRFIHAAPDAPAVDIAVAGGPVIFSNVSFTQNSDYVVIPVGKYNLEVRISGTQQVVLKLPTLAFQSATSYSAIAVGQVSKGTLQAILAVDD